MRDTIGKGDVTKLAVALALAKRGEHVLMPFSEGERYDLAIDRGGALYRVQCKTGRLRRGAVLFKVCSHGPRSTPRTYVGHVEAFGVYCREINRTFLVPIDAVSHIKGVARLRIEPRRSKNGRDAHEATAFEV